MATAIIYTKSGGGKTVNASRVEGKTLLIDSDTSSVVLQNFDRSNVTVKKILSIANFMAEFETSAGSGEYQNIIVDNVTDIIDRWLLELGAIGKNGGNPGIQDYQTVYNGIKRLVRKAADCGVNVILNFWQDTYIVTNGDGPQTSMLSPKMPQKILENICGLCNIVAHIEVYEKDADKTWYYNMVGSNNLYAKDQLFCRKTCMPEDIFNGKGKK
jgi:phage nucleotide-binding protein